MREPYPGMSDFFVRQGEPTQESFVDFKEVQRSMAEKAPSSGCGERIRAMSQPKEGGLTHYGR